MTNSPVNVLSFIEIQEILLYMCKKKLKQPKTNTRDNEECV